MQTHQTLALVALLELVAGAAVAQAPAAPAGDAAHGKQIYIADGCSRCHGTTGEGSDSTGPKIAPGVVPYGFFSNQLRNPRQRMPLYTAAVLPDQDVADIYAYVKTVPPTKKLSDVPILNR